MKKNRPKTRSVSDQREGTMRKLVILTAAAALALTLGAGNAFAYEEVVIVKCMEEVNIVDNTLDVDPQVYQFQASGSIPKPTSCDPDWDFPFTHTNPCAQCLGDLINQWGCKLQGMPAVVMLADPNRDIFPFRSVEKYVLVCDPYFYTGGPATGPPPVGGPAVGPPPVGPPAPPAVGPPAPPAVGPPAPPAVGGACAGQCGGSTPQGCWCDASCAQWGDCCAGVCSDCGFCP